MPSHAPREVLSVSILRATNLPQQSVAISDIDPYAVVFYNGIRDETKRVINNPNPRWFFTREFDIMDPENVGRVRIEVYDQAEDAGGPAVGGAKAVGGKESRAPSPAAGEAQSRGSSPSPTPRPVSRKSLQPGAVAPGAGGVVGAGGAPVAQSKDTFIGWFDVDLAPTPSHRYKYHEFYKLQKRTKFTSSTKKPELAGGEVEVTIEYIVPKAHPHHQPHHGSGGSGIGSHPSSPTTSGAERPPPPAAADGTGTGSSSDTFASAAAANETAADAVARKALSAPEKPAYRQDFGNNIHRLPPPTTPSMLSGELKGCMGSKKSGGKLDILGMMDFSGPGGAGDGSVAGEAHSRPLSLDVGGGGIPGTGGSVSVQQPGGEVQLSVPKFLNRFAFPLQNLFHKSMLPGNGADSHPGHGKEVSVVTPYRMAPGGSESLSLSLVALVLLSLSRALSLSAFN